MHHIENAADNHEKQCKIVHLTIWNQGLQHTNYSYQYNTRVKAQFSKGI